MWVFPKRRFDIVLHTFNPCTGKILHMHLTIFQWMREFISCNMFGNASSIITFFCWLAIYIHSYNIITIWVLTNCLFISFELFIAVLYFISIIHLNESSTSGLTKSIFFEGFLTKIWFPLLTEVLWEWYFRSTNNDSVIKWLAMNCRFRPSVCSFKAATNTELFEHFSSVSVLKSSGLTLLQFLPCKLLLRASSVTEPSLDHWILYKW